MRKIALLFSVIIILLQACNPDIETDAPYKDIVITYALLNPGDSIQYIKIYKGFQTPGNAYEAASQMQNIYYYDSIEVVLHEMENERSIKSIRLDTTTAIPKNPGVFAHPKQLLYYTAEPIKPNTKYELRIKNKYTGKVVTAQTYTLDQVAIQNPNEAYGIPLIIHLDNSFVRFSTVPYANAYEIYMLFKYIEVNKVTGKIVKRGVVNRKLTSAFIRGNSDNVRFGYNSSLIYDFIKQSLKEDPTITRYKDGTKCLEFQVWAAEKNFIAYMDAQKVNSSVIQDRTIYTNFESSDHTAYGILSSRSKKTATFDIHKFSEDSLVKGSKTEKLGFDYYKNYMDKNN